MKQSFATRSESVTPFLISFWNGTLELTPASDSWVDTARLEAKIIDVEGNYTSTFDSMVDAGEIDPQTGFGPTTWSSWTNNWTGVDVVESTRRRVIQNGPDTIHRQGGGGRARQSVNRRQVTDAVIEERLRSRREFGTATRVESRTIVAEQFDRESVGDRVVSRDLIAFMRSRNVEFVSKKVKPLTRLYAFFDGVDISKYCVPKLMEITMESGVFAVGETIVGTTPVVGDIGASALPSAPFIRFRVSQSNHREGPYDSPTKTFRQNPYNSQDFRTELTYIDTNSKTDQFSYGEIVPILT